MASLPPAARAAAVSGAQDVEAMRGAIHRQIDAVRDRDGAALLASLAPAARGRFTDQGAVLAAMSERLPFIATARHLEFADLRPTAQGLTQMIRVADARGETWLAFFVLERGAKGVSDWSIANVIAVKVPTLGV